MLLKNSVLSARFRSVFAAGFQVPIYRKAVFYLAPRDCAATYHVLEPPTQYTAHFIFCILENQLQHTRAQRLPDWEIPVWVHQAQGAQTNKLSWGKVQAVCGGVLETNSNERLFSWKMGTYNH